MGRRGDGHGAPNQQELVSRGAPGCGLLGGAGAMVYLRHSLPGLQRLHHPETAFLRQPTLVTGIFLTLTSNNSNIKPWEIQSQQEAKQTAGGFRSRLRGGLGVREVGKWLSGFSCCFVASCSHWYSLENGVHRELAARRG